MKIDLVIGSLAGGGAERVVSTLANHFSKKGHEVRLITFKNGDKYELDDKIKRLRFHKNLPLFNYALLRAFFYLISFYWKRNNRPDVISAHIGLMGLPTIPIAKLYNINITVSEHINHSHTPINLKRKFLWQILYKYADAITILTSYDLSFFKSKNKNVKIIHNPNSFKPINFINQNRSKHIVAIGNLDRYNHKGFDNLLDVAYRIKNIHPDWSFKIIGEGEHGRKFLEKKIKNLNLGNTVFLEGFQSNIDEILGNSSIFILTSRYEGLPMALVEALSQGVACISYDCISGPSDIIENGKSGILVENQNKIAMSNELINLINDKQLRDELGANALIQSEKFSLEKIGKQWIELFQTISNN